MHAERLLRLYPPASRSRYGEEFLALAGDRSLSVLQTRRRPVSRLATAGSAPPR